MKDVIIKKIHKAYINNDQKTLELMRKKYAPTSLIKFYNGKYDKKGSNNYLNLLRNSELWLSSTECFNDPFDSLYNIDCEELARKTFDDFLFEEFKHRPKHINNKEKENLIIKWTNRYNNTFENIKNNSYMTCFAEKSNLISDSMWGYYANSHKGFCVEYDFVPMLRYKILPVLYTKKHCILNSITKNSREFALGITFNKAIEWKHEKEWRICYTTMIDTKEQPGIYIPFEKPLAIYLGCLSSERLRKDIIDICKTQKIKLYEMCLMPNRFEMNYRPINL